MMPSSGCVCAQNELRLVKTGGGFIVSPQRGKSMSEEKQSKPKKKWYKKWWVYPLIALGLLIILFRIGLIVGKGQPMFRNIKSPVYDSPITIESYNVEPNARVDIFLNGKQIASVNADEEGKFSASLGLLEGENTLKVSTVTSEGKTKTSATKRIEYIIKAPNLEILEPTTDMEVENPKITIKGRTDKNSRVEIQDSEIEVDENSNFESIVTLSVGTN